jgi:hypothetical protein
MCDYRRGFGLVNRFIDHLQVVTTYNTIDIPTLYSLLAFSVCYYKFPGNGFNNGYSTASGQVLSSQTPVQNCQLNKL